MGLHFGKVWILVTWTRRDEGLLSERHIYCRASTNLQPSLISLSSFGTCKHFKSLYPASVRTRRACRISAEAEEVLRSINRSWHSADPPHVTWLIFPSTSVYLCLALHESLTFSLDWSFICKHCVQIVAATTENTPVEQCPRKLPI